MIPQNPLFTLQEAGEFLHLMLAPNDLSLPLSIGGGGGFGTASLSAPGSGGGAMASSSDPCNVEALADCLDTVINEYQSQVSEASGEYKGKVEAAANSLHSAGFAIGTTSGVTIGVAVVGAVVTLVSGGTVPIIIGAASLLFTATGAAVGSSVALETYTNTVKCRGRCFS